MIELVAVQHSVDSLHGGEEKEAAGVLARAFVDNPGMLAILDRSDREERLELLKRGFLSFIEATLHGGRIEVVRADGAIAGVQLTVPPGCYPLGLKAQWRMIRGPLSAGPYYAVRYAVADAILRRHHPKTPHHYLWVLGVEPSFQGRGVGGTLLRALNARADARNSDCYLETDKESSVRLYERHGYRVIWDETFPRLNHLRIWWMLRAPTPP